MPLPAFACSIRADLFIMLKLIIISFTAFVAFTGCSTVPKAGQGIMVGEVTDSSVLVQVRLNDEWADLVRKRQQRAEAIREKLQVVVRVDFQEMPLVEALTSLLGSAAVEWFLDIRALADEGIRPTEP